jgi:regulator of vacuolar morphogenesis
MGAWTWGILGKCREVGELSTEDVGAIRDLGRRAAKICEKIGEANSQYVQVGSDSDVGEDDSNEVASPECDTEHDVTRQTEIVGDSDMPDATTESEDLEAAKARLQAQLQGEDDTETAGDTEKEERDYVLQLTRAMLDMILTVVGEFFGQRDLLEARQTWAS